LGDAPKRHWLVVVSLDSRNLSDRASSVLIIPFGSVGAAGPATLKLLPGESGLPFPSYLKAHFIQVLEKKALIERHAPNAFSWTHKDGRRNDPTRRRSRCAVVGETLNGTLVICIILGTSLTLTGRREIVHAKRGMLGIHLCFLRPLW
jgi:hypothetical protein